MNDQPARSWHPLFWGNTIALSWMWGLGLFFSVQFTFQFGLAGLLAFAIPNAVGLFLFGSITQRVADRKPGGDSLAEFFDRWSKPFNLPLLLYQLAALSLTIFAIVRYLWQPLGLAPEFIYLPLGVLIVLAAAFLFGEEFSIKRIKWSHSAMMLLIVAAVAAMLLSVRPALFSSGRSLTGREPFEIASFLGYLVPICVGFLVGPWMDLQQWQRAIQIHREKRSIVKSYAIGSTLFFLLLLFHGGLANWALASGAVEFVRTGLLDFAFGHRVLTQFFHSQIEIHPVAFWAYATFVCVCILSTLDSGYIALRWFFVSYVSKSQSLLFSLIPAKLLTSPIPAFLIATFFALVALVFGLELEYFMMLYATFFVVYSALGMVRVIRGKTDLPLAQVKMFCVGALSLVIFSFGYLREIPFFLIVGSLVPIGYIFWLAIKSQTTPDEQEILVEKGASISKAGTSEGDRGFAPEGSAALLDPSKAATDRREIIAQAEAGELGPSVGHFEGKRFVHTFLSTYADTNSVGNVYFGMYAMWVGRTRELFFNQVLPDFDLETTSYYILTRSFEHKFVREAKEFEEIRIELSIGEHNRKFATLEHRVLDGANKVLGKGKQSLMFVASKDYSLIDIPPEVHTAFVPYAPMEG